MWIVQFLKKPAMALIFGLLSCVGTAQAQLRSDLHVFSDSFISPSFEATDKINYQFIGMSLKSAALSDDTIKMHIDGAVAFGAPLLNYLNISELYFQNKQSEHERLFIGRKILNWSELDTRWNLGLWQPLFQWNPLNPEQQGLTGLFWQAEREKYAITVFASPIFIPNQGPAFEIVNGQFVQGNPWFRRPPESVQIFSETTQVDYKFEKPNESQVVFQASYGARLTFGIADNATIQLSYMYKPSNELALGYSGVLDTSTLHGVVDLKPQVFYHTLSGLDYSQKFEHFRYGLSGVVDRPQKDLNFDPQWTHPEFSDAYLIGPFIEFTWPGITFALESLNIYGGEIHEVGDMASSDRAPLTMIYPFQQAVKASLETRFRLRGTQRLSSKLSYTISDKNDFEYLEWNTNYRFSSLWSIYSELELVRAGDLTAGNQNEIAQYRNDDRFMLGVSYVF